MARNALASLAMASALLIAGPAQGATRPAQTNFAHAVVNIDQDPSRAVGWWQQNGWLVFGLGIAATLGFLVAMDSGPNSPG